ncbi:MAG TPA: oxidoreductase [Pseudonocardiaceae bacterium]
MNRRTADPLAPLLDLPGVAEAVAAARAAVDDVHRHPVNRHGWPATAAEASLRAARASALLSGGSAALSPASASDAGDANDAGAAGAAGGAAVSDPVLAGCVRIADAVGTVLATWQRAPLQALARLHVLAAADLVSDDELLGRPRPEPAVSARLHQLAGLVTGGSAVPGVVLAAVVHGELLTLAPFGSADAVVARAASRLTAIATGLDAKGLAVPEVGHLAAATEYREAAAAFAGGTAEGLARWLVHCCDAWVAGAREARSIAAAAAV